MGERKIIGFVSGCFDWTTPAHVKLFRLAKEQCDELHVLMADDETVRYFKGPARPLLSYEERFILVINCQHVDYVHCLRKLPDESNQRDLIQEIQPHVYFEGNDQTDEFIGKYLKEFFIDRVVLSTNLPHVSEYLRRYDQRRYDATYNAHQDLYRIAGL